ncbi:MAG TPA: TetR/AcrR family transcriptional regulator [Acidimicrobiales bacterium]
MSGDPEKAGVPEAGDATGSWRTFEPLELTPLLHHGLEEFVQHGYDGTTVRAIAKRANISLPSIYYHYENKQGLLVHLLDLSVDDLIHRVEAALAEAGPAPVDRFSAFVEAVVLYVAHRRELALLDDEIRSLEPGNRAAYVAKRDIVEGWLREVIEDGIASGDFEVAYPSEARRAILSMCRGVASWYDPVGRLDPDELARRYVTFALPIVGVVPDHAPQA